MTEEKKTYPCDAYGDLDGRPMAIWVLGEQGNFTETLLPYLLTIPCQYEHTLRNNPYGSYHQQRIFEIPENWDPYSYCISYLGMDPLLIVTDLYDVDPKRSHRNGFVLLDPLHRKAVWHYWCNPQGAFAEPYLTHGLPFRQTPEAASRPHYPGALDVGYKYPSSPDGAVYAVWNTPWWSALENSSRVRVGANATGLAWVPVLDPEQSLIAAIERAEEFRTTTIRMQTAPSDEMSQLRAIQHGSVEIYELPEWWYDLIRNQAQTLSEIPIRLIGMILLFPSLVITPEGCIRLTEQPNIAEHMGQLVKQKDYAGMEALYDLMYTKIVEYLGSLRDKADWYIAEFVVDLSKPSYYLPAQALGYKKPPQY